MSRTVYNRLMARGDGTLYKRGSVYYFAHWQDGAQKKLSTGKRKLSDARTWRDRFLKRGGDSLPERVTCGELLDEWLQYQRTHCKPYTVRVWEWTLEEHLRPFFGNIRAAILTSAKLKEYRDKVGGSGKKATTANRHLAILRMALHHGRKCTPPKVLNVPWFPMDKEDNARQGFLEDGQYQSVLEALPDVGLKALFVVAFFTGIRRGELLAIRLDQVDLERGFIVLKAEETKGGEARSVPIFEGDMDNFVRLAISESRDGYLFTREGRRIKNFRAAWEKACEQAKCPGLMFHSMRRTAVRNLRRAGVPQVVRMKISGHKTTSMEQRYNIVDTDDLEVAKTLMKKTTNSTQG